MPRQSSIGSRPRPPRSCRYCSRRKVACDKAKPRCGRCAAAGLQCHYANYETPLDGSLTFIDETPTIAAQQRQDVSSRLDRLGRMINEYDIPPQAGEPSSQNTAFFQGAETDWNPEEGKAGQYGSEPDDKPGIEDPGNLLVGPQTKARYVSPAFWAMISKEVSEINELLRNQQRYLVNHVRDDHVREEIAPDETSSTLRPASQIDSPRAEDKRLYGDIFPYPPAFASQEFPAGQLTKDSHITEIVSGMPSESQCDALIQSYLSGYHTISPMFDSPSFQQTTRQFFQRIRSPDGDYQISFHFLALLSAVLFAGSVICPRARVRDAFGDINREQLSIRLYKQAVNALRLSDFPRGPSVQSLAAFLIVDTTWLRAEQPLTCCSFIGVAVRVAQILGLHKEPSKFPDISPIDVHVRRQLWWNLLALDAQIAYAAGLPPIIQPTFYDVRPITELSDSTNTISSDNDSDSNISKSIVRIFVAGRFDFYRISGELLDKMHNTFFNEKDLDALLGVTSRIQAELQTCREQIASILKNNRGETILGELGFRSSTWAISPAILGQFTKMVLSMLAAKPFAVMYGVVRRHGLLERLREKVPSHMMYCREYLHRFLRLTQCRDFQPFHGVYPGNFQPLYSILALIQDLEDNPDDPLATETRKLIDLALYLTGPQRNNGIISYENGDPDVRPLNEGGSEAWAFIRRAREKAWEKADLDPAVLRCPENADDIHFDGFPGNFGDDTALPNDIFDESTAGPFPDLGEDWAFLGDAHDPQFGNLGLEFEL